LPYIMAARTAGINRNEEITSLLTYVYCICYIFSDFQRRLVPICFGVSRQLGAIASRSDCGWRQSIAGGTTPHVARLAVRHSVNSWLVLAVTTFARRSLEQFRRCRTFLCRRVNLRLASATCTVLRHRIYLRSSLTAHRIDSHVM